MTHNPLKDLVMSPEEFVAEYKSKGWTQALLAERWGFTDPRRVRQIKAQPERWPMYIDAVRGLPNLKQ